MKLTMEQIEVMERIIRKEVISIETDEDSIMVRMETGNEDIDEYLFYDDGSVARRLSGSPGMISNWYDIIKVDEAI